MRKPQRARNEHTIDAIRCTPRAPHTMGNLSPHTTDSIRCTLGATAVPTSLSKLNSHASDRCVGYSGRPFQSCVGYSGRPIRAWHCNHTRWPHAASADVRDGFPNTLERKGTLGLNELASAAVVPLNEPGKNYACVQAAVMKSRRTQCKA